MRRGFLVGRLTVLLVTGFVMSAPLSGQSGATRAPHVGEGGVPQFQADPAWPKLPAKWRLGHASAVAIDAQDHVWILHRPRTLPPELRAQSAPPVLEFDNAGNFIQGWGGPGEGYQWPENEHGLHVDYKGFVWVVGNAQPQDGQILKFTKAGKLVMQIGKSGQTGGNATQFLKGAAGLRVDPATNELYVSDGYGNSRVMVYDAETGKFKRMWGAYGNTPLDAAMRPKRAAPAQNPWPAVAEVLQQMNTVHDVAISNDGLVYVSDRGNKRIQVFTREGKYVAQQFFGLDSPEYLQARSTAFSPDPAQQFLYVSGTPVIYIVNRQTLEILASFVTGSAQEHPPGHQITADAKGNLYAVQAEQTGADGKSGGAGAQKFLFKGFSPRTTAP